MASLSRCSPKLWNAARSRYARETPTIVAILIGKNSEGGGCSLGLQYRMWLRPVLQGLTPRLSRHTIPARIRISARV